MDNKLVPPKGLGPGIINTGLLYRSLATPVLFLTSPTHFDSCSKLLVTTSYLYHLLIAFANMMNGEDARKRMGEIIAEYGAAPLPPKFDTKEEERESFKDRLAKACRILEFKGYNENLLGIMTFRVGLSIAYISSSSSDQCITRIL